MIKIFTHPQTHHEHCTNLKERKFCLVFSRWETCCVQASVSLLLKSLIGNTVIKTWLYSPILNNQVFLPPPSNVDGARCQRLMTILEILTWVEHGVNFKHAQWKEAVRAPGKIICPQIIFTGEDKIELTCLPWQSETVQDPCLELNMKWAIPDWCSHFRRHLGALWWTLTRELAQIIWNKCLRQIGD